MKQLSKRLITLLLSVIMLFTVIPVSAFAANYDTNYAKYPVPARTLKYTGGPTLKGNDVKWFQCAINDLVAKGKLSTNKLDVDGSFGKASRTAVYAFQAEYKNYDKNNVLAYDGSFGTASRTVMQKVLKAASIDPEKKYYTVGPGSGRVSYYNRSVAYFSNSAVAGQMISSITGSNGSFYFNLNENNDNDRTGYIYAYNSSNVLIATIQILQQGTYVKAERLTPNENLQLAWEGGKCLSSLGGDVVRYKITSNRVVNIRIEDEKGSYLYKTVGKDLFEANKKGTYYVDVEFPNNPTVYNRHLGIAALAGNKSSRPEVFYQPVSYNRIDASNSIYPLGSIVFEGYRYKIVTRDNIPVNGYTVVDRKDDKCSSFDWSEFLSTELEEGNYQNIGGALAGMTLQFIPSVVAGKNNAIVELTFYKSASNLRYAKIEVYDSSIIRKMQEYAGVDNPFVDLEDGRKMQMHFDEKHADWGDRAYDGYVNNQGEFCVAFHGYKDDYIRIRETIGWAWSPDFSIVPWYEYGYDNAHTSPFELMKAPEGYKKLLYNAINK